MSRNNFQQGVKIKS